MTDNLNYCEYCKNIFDNKNCDEINFYSERFCSKKCKNGYASSFNTFDGRSKAGKIGGKITQEQHRKNGTNFFNKEFLTKVLDKNRQNCRGCYFNKKLQSEAGKIGIKKTLTINKRYKLGYCYDPKIKKIALKNSILTWKNYTQIQKEERLSKMLIGQRKRPTSFEKKIFNFLDMNNMHFRYVGNGNVFISGRNPDFIDDEMKIIIEVYYSYFKIKSYGSIINYVSEFKQRYNNAGYKVIFFDEKELNSKNWKIQLLQKIINSYDDVLIAA